MESVISVRRATAGDGAAVLACMREAFAPYQSRYTPGAYEDTVPKSLDVRLKTMTIFVAMDGSEVVGTIACIAHRKEGHLRGMAVRAAWQGKNVAEKLLRTSEEELRARRCQRITLDTTEPLERAMRFYEKHGYRRSGRVTAFFGMRLHEWVKSL